MLFILFRQIADGKSSYTNTYSLFYNDFLYGYVFCFHKFSLAYIFPRRIYSNPQYSSILGWHQSALPSLVLADEP